MTMRGWLGAAAIAGLVWFNSTELAVPVRLWTTILLAGLPPLMVLQAHQLRDAGPLPRQAAYVSSIISLWVLAIATLILARAGGIDLPGLGLVPMAPAPLFAWTAGLTAAGLLVVLLFHRLGLRESDITRQLVPRSPAEKTTFIGVSITAGICEELVFRGFLIPVLRLASGSWILALLLSSFVFGVVHAYQQPAGALRAGLLGALLALPLLLHGSIYPAILAHAVIDVITGLWLARYLLR